MPLRTVCLPSVALAAAFAVATPSLAAPPAPSNFVANDASTCGSILITWNPVAGAEGYRLFRDGVLIGVIAGSLGRFIDYAMPGPGLYGYTLEAFDPSGSSATVADQATLPVSPVTVEPYDWFHDVFPSDNNPALPGTFAFDRTTAVLATGHNLAPCVGAMNRQVLPGKRVLVRTVGAVDRVDMIFRIKPGPGNYSVVGNVNSCLLRDPHNPGFGCSAPGDGSFWGRYKANPGDFASPGAVVKHALAPSGWDVNVWNSARCEAQGGGVYASTDFGAPGTNLLPDDLFTPGTHVEYQFRVQFTGGPAQYIPEDDCVMQVRGEGSTDGHRWEHFGVLPDRWKDPAYLGLGDACALVVVLDDRHGNERVWVSTADSIGATAPARYGAHNGWHALGTLPGANPVDVDDPLNNRRPGGTIGFVDDHGGQPGTTWDLYVVRGANVHCEGNAGALGGRLGVVPPGETPPGPTPEMLTAYYRILLVLSGGRSQNILGPLPDRSQDDVAILQNFLLSSSLFDPKGLMVEGSGFAEDAAATPGSPQETFLTSFLGATLVNPDYRTYSGNPRYHADVIPVAPLPDQDLYGVVNTDEARNDVLGLNLAVPEAQVVSYYENYGVSGPYFASVYKPPAPARPWRALIDGWDIANLGGRWVSTSYGRLAYHFNAFQNVFGDMCWFLSPSATTDVPMEGHGRGPGESLRVLDNPLRAAHATLEFELASPGRARLVLCDVSGRVVRTLADRSFEAGRHQVPWDGTDDRGARLPRGVYFAQVRAADGTPLGAAKLALLK